MLRSRFIKCIIYSLVITFQLFSNVFADVQKIARGHKVFLQDQQGKELLIGTLSLSEEGKVIHYKLVLDREKFQDYFLSMKEMKCLEGPELWCHLAYPYKHLSTIRRDDLRWLSHDLLFMYKKPNEFGANFWNGIYYDLRYEGGTIKGEARAVDLNLLASPPDDFSTPPFTEGDMGDIDQDKRWLPSIEIR